MTIYDLKPAFQNLLRPLTRRLAARGVTANQVTLFTCLMSIALGVWITIRKDVPTDWVLVPIGLFLRMALNAIDGMLAREHAMKSRLGAILNELTDVASDSAIYLPFALLPGSQPFLVVLIVLLSQLTEMAGVLGLQVGRTRRYDGPMGKSDRAFVFGLVGLLYACGIPMESYLSGVWAVVIVLLIRTLVNRCSRALAEEPPRV